MHKIGDKIIYGANGVMTIVDIREESVGDVSRSYYVLLPATGRASSLTFVPTDNEKLTSAMRPMLMDLGTAKSLKNLQEHGHLMKTTSSN
jgi:RNA polymerase-interacting CarD/CdnL/TRCF family regulator